ncbi:hypothetical protein ABK040_007238 [Willaertia magna]
MASSSDMREKKVIELFPLASNYLNAKISFPCIIKKELIPYDYLIAHKGCTKTSNWLIPDCVVMSSYPGDLNESKAREKIRNFLSIDKVRVFISLQEPAEMKRFAPYIPLVKEEAKNLGLKENEIEFLNFPIVDDSVGDDEKVQTFTSELVDRVHNHQRLLIHCYGGHGRTGTISTIMMCKLFPHISVKEALLRVALSHDSRDDPRGYPSPQNHLQVEQVKRVVEQFRKN